MSRQIAEPLRASTKPHELRRALLRCQDQEGRSVLHAAVRIRGGEIGPIEQTQRQLLSQAARTCEPTQLRTVDQASARALLLGLGPIRPESTSIEVTIFFGGMPCFGVARVSLVTHSEVIDGRTDISRGSRPKPTFDDDRGSCIDSLKTLRLSTARSCPQLRVAEYLMAAPALLYERPPEIG